MVVVFESVILYLHGREKDSSGMRQPVRRSARPEGDSGGPDAEKGQEVAMTPTVIALRGRDGLRISQETFRSSVAVRSVRVTFHGATVACRKTKNAWKCGKCQRGNLGARPVIGARCKVCKSEVVQ